MSRNSRYNTYDGEALRIAAQRILRRPEKRKILFWMGDGWPCANCTQFNHIHTAYLKTIAQQVERQIEVFAMGINADFSEFFTNAAQVTSVRDLPKIAVTELDRLLRKGLHGHRRAG
jgi:cobaltochelatase CobT